MDQHSHEPQGAASPPRRQPNAQTVIDGLNESLNQRANEIRTLQDQLVYERALVADFTNENASLVAAMDQIVAENRMLRARSGLPEVGPVELTDEEAASLPAEMVTEVPDEAGPDLSS